MNFERMNKELRERVVWRVETLIDKVLEDHFIKGGKFDPKWTFRMFKDCVQTAELIEDLLVGTGLHPLETGAGLLPSEGEERKDEVSDLGSGDSERPTGSEGDADWVRDPDSPRDETGDNGPTRGGEIDPPELEPAPPKPRS